MTSWTRKILAQFGAAKPDADVLVNPPKPDMALAIIGDIHGRDDLVAKLLPRILAEGDDRQLVFVGDYVDRGAQSRHVLERLQALPAICLKGNHEAMLLAFLDDPVENGGRWLRNGGRPTLASYDVSMPETPSVDDLRSGRDRFRAHLGEKTETWLRHLALYWQSGNLVVNHAGPDPARPIRDQDDKVFLWGHQRFLRDARTDGLWVAHGHWVRDFGGCAAGRISLDTGAWETDRLTAALIDPDGRVRFIDSR